MSSKGNLPSSAPSPVVTERKQAEEVLQEREEAYLDLLENAHDLVQSVAPDGRFLYVNRRWRETLGYTEEEISRLSLFDIIHPDSQAHCMEIFQQVISGGSVDRVEAAFVTKDGKKVMVEGSANCRFVDGKPVATRGIFRDITERREVEEAVKSERDKLQALMNGLASTGIGIDIVGFNYKVQFQNRTLEERFGDLTGKLCYENYMGLQKPCDFCPMVEAIKSNKVESAELTAADGRDYALFSAPFLNPDGTVDKAIEVILDITERKQAEEKLQHAAQEWRDTFDAISDLVSIHDKDFKIVRVNKAYANAFKMKPQELIGKTCYEVVHGAKEPWPDCPHKRVLETKKPATVQFFEPRLGIYLEVSASPIFDDKGEVTGTVHLAKDITERKRAEEVLRESERRYRLLADNATDAIWTVDMNMRPTYMSPSITRLLGYSVEEAMTKAMEEVFTPASFEVAMKVLAEELAIEKMGQNDLLRSRVLELELNRKDGSIVPVELGCSLLRGPDAQPVGILTIARDITERKRVEELYRTLVSSSPAGIHIIQDGKFVFVNPQVQKDLDFTADELLGTDPSQYVHPDDRERVRKEVVDMLKGNRSSPYEFRLISKGGEIIWVLGTVTPIHYEGKRARLENLVNITERKQVEAALRESEEKFYKAFHASPGPMSVSTLADGRFTDVNESFTQLMGYSREEAIGHTVVELGIWVKAGENYRVAQILREHGVIRGLDFEFRTKSGKVLTVLFSAETINLGGEQCVIAAVNDITERKRLEHNLRERVNELECLYGIAVITEKPGITLDELCQQVVNLLPAGWQYPEITGTRIIIKDRKFETGNYRETGWKQSSDIRVRGAKAGVVEVCYLEERPEIDEGPFSREERMLISAVAERVGENIERMQAEEELVEKTRQLEAASGAKSEFLASMSHELRTPLNAIMGFSELLLDGVPGEINDEQRECLSDVLGSGQHLLALINDVLDLSKVEARKVELRLENVNLADIIDGVVQAVKPMLDDNGHQLKVRVEAGLPQVHADRKRLRQVLLNLLSNAIKFTPAGGKLGIEVSSQGEWCQVSVVDSGIGIKKEDQERIFEAFTQVDTLPKRNKEGTGLGLALTRQFVEMYGGKIWVESEYGKGSTFTFTLPLVGEGEPPLEEDKKELGEGLLKQRDLVSR